MVTQLLWMWSKLSRKMRVTAMVRRYSTSVGLGTLPSQGVWPLWKGQAAKAV